jgi:anti-anti-sigma factor
MDGLVHIIEETRGDVLILRMSGRLDAISSPIAECKVFDFINKGQYKLLLDLAEIELISSAGMRMLLSVTKKLKTTSGKLILCSVNPSVIEVLKMSGFNHVLELAGNEENGLRKF